MWIGPVTNIFEGEPEEKHFNIKDLPPRPPAIPSVNECWQFTFIFHLNFFSLICWVLYVVVPTSLYIFFSQ